MKDLIWKDVPVRTGPNPYTLDNSSLMFPSWWPGESSPQPTSASAGCENKFIVLNRVKEYGKGILKVLVWFFIFYDD